jgi:hypothetical protein
MFYIYWVFRGKMQKHVSLFDVSEEEEKSVLCYWQVQAPPTG